MNRFPRGVPVTPASLTPTQRCQDLRQRAMSYTRKAHAVRLSERMIDNLIEKLSNRQLGFTSFGAFIDGDGAICVWQRAGGHHLNCRGRLYHLRGGRVVWIGRDQAP